MIHDGIYDMVMDEVARRKMYNYEIYEPYFICSYTMHNFNIMNHKKRAFYINGNIDNMRLHLLQIAPPGSMKSYNLNINGNDDYAIFKNAGCKIQRKQSMTEASFVGSVSNMNGSHYKRNGIAEDHKHDIISVDEFNGLLAAMSSANSGQFESQLLSALDHGHINKDLAGGDPIEYDTNCTIWTGIQPTRLDVSGGLGRRLCFLVYTPTEEDDRNMKRLMYEAYDQKPNKKEMRDMWRSIKTFNAQMNNIESINLDDSLLSYYDKNNVYSYETTIYNRLAIAYTIAKYGIEPNISVSFDDPELRRIFDSQLKWRKAVYFGIDFMIIKQIIALNGNQISTSELIKKCRMYGWNVPQVHKMLKEMEEQRIIRRKVSTIQLL